MAIFGNMQTKFFRTLFILGQPENEVRNPQFLSLFGEEIL